MKKAGFFLTAALFLAGCNGIGSMIADDKAVPVTEAPAPAIEVKMINVEGKQAGTALLNETAEGVKVALKVKGLEPGEKAVHFHEKASCEPPEFTSAGGHFNPHKKQHGFENPKGFHAGDLPNLVVDRDGTVDLELTVEAVTLKNGAENSLLDPDGSTLVIHEGPDDYKTDPAGNSGKRIICGEIKS
ncbi:superoxide dismutase family protein [Jeotgalibacillus proteolyticus]|uniref:Superoxide dismutase n=1 Tax=Jeotgalibacillus proteolyticus TaxID=2082395 RepID=A0A2S5GCH7_9BACL|nr:superoxide dismutase family protein [Jeotgalibacillus proteolyticus]PPA70742.1 superoxide dismutase [Jeotgalibacillus proteolyticus]